jgi:hypothetical protein
MIVTRLYRMHLMFLVAQSANSFVGVLPLSACDISVLTFVLLEGGILFKERF